MINWLSDGCLQVNWSHSAALRHQDGMVIVILELEGNPYWYFYYEHAAKCSLEMDMPPGTVGRMWVRFEPDAQGVLNSWTRGPKRTVIAPEVTPISKFGYGCDSLGLKQTGAKPKGLLSRSQPELDLTLAGIESGEQTVSIEVRDHYSVVTEQNAHLLVALHTPEGYVFYESAPYVLHPDFGEGNTWSRDVTELFRLYLDYAYLDKLAPGEYRVEFYLDGELAGGRSFVVN